MAKHTHRRKLKQVLWALPIVLGLSTAKADIPLEIQNSNFVVESVIVASEDRDGFVSDYNKVIEFDDRLTLYAVTKARVDGQIKYFCDTKNLVIDGKRIPESLIQKFDLEDRVDWFKVEPDCDGKWFSNSKSYGDFDHFTPIDYVETFIGSCTSIKCDVRPVRLTPVIVDDIPVGTMRFKFELIHNGMKYATPGKEAVEKIEVSEKVHRISRKSNRENEIVNYAFSLCNLPYIWASTSMNGSIYDNQAGRFLGGDCADFCVAAARLAGNNLFYTSSMNLPRQLRVINNINEINNGTYENNGAQITNAREGDLILWHRHVGIFSRDMDPKGVLTVEDLVLHTLFEEPREETIGNAYHGNFKILRVVK